MSNIINTFVEAVKTGMSGDTAMFDDTGASVPQGDSSAIVSVYKEKAASDIADKNVRHTESPAKAFSDMSNTLLADNKFLDQQARELAPQK